MFEYACCWSGHISGITKKKSFQWGFSPDVIFMVHYQSEISDALHLPLFILCCYFFLFSWSTQQVKTDSYKLNPTKSPLCVCYHKVFTFEQSAGEGKRDGFCEQKWFEINYTGDKLSLLVVLIRQSCKVYGFIWSKLILWNGLEMSDRWPLTVLCVVRDREGNWHEQLIFNLEIF